jgi:hypothetical protein
VITSPVAPDWMVVEPISPVKWKMDGVGVSDRTK